MTGMTVVSIIAVSRFSQNGMYSTYDLATRQSLIYLVLFKLKRGERALVL